MNEVSVIVQAKLHDDDDDLVMLVEQCLEMGGMDHLGTYTVRSIPSTRPSGEKDTHDNKKT